MGEPVVGVHGPGEELGGQRHLRSDPSPPTVVNLADHAGVLEPAQPGVDLSVGLPGDAEPFPQVLKKLIT